MSIRDSSDLSSTLSAGQRRQLEKRLAQARASITSPSPSPDTKARITRRAHPDIPAPLSFAQQRLWFLDQLAPGNPFYNIAQAARLTGSLDVEALAHALNELVKRHEVLRTNFVMREGQPVQIVSPVSDFSLKVVDLREMNEVRRARELTETLTTSARRSFDLSSGSLFEVQLIALGRAEHVLLLSMHHIISDARSLHILIEELAGAYEAFVNGRTPLLPELPIQYSDYATWQRRWLQGEVLEAQLSYWKRQLSDAPVLLELPTDFARPHVASLGGARQRLRIPGPLVESLQALGRTCDATLFMTLLAAWQTLLWRYTSQREIVVGTAITNRQNVETEPLIGFFLNMLALRTSFSDELSFVELLGRVREMLLAAFDNQDVPFEKVVEHVQPTRTLSHAPLFQVLFALHKAPARALELAGLRLEMLEAENETAKFDLQLSLLKDEDGLLATLEYRTDLFRQETIRRMLNHYLTLLEAIAANPAQSVSALPLLTESEQHELLVVWNETKTAYPQTETFHSLFEAVAERTPDAIAVAYEETRLTYGELNRRANQVAHYLRRSGVGPASLVAILMERSVEMLVALLGILKAGGAYLPLDPGQPTQRLSFMLEDARPGALLCHQSLAASIPESLTRIILIDADWPTIAQEREVNPNFTLSSEHPAYVIYTSGSTGRPKGTIIAHRSVVNLATALRRSIYSQSGSPLKVSLNAPLAFDASVQQLIQLFDGHALYIIPEETRRNAEALLSFVEQWGLNVLDCTPSHLKLLLGAGLAQRLSADIVLVGGEALDESLWAALAEHPRTKFYNVYGPTECTVNTTACLLRSAPKQPTIGRPIANVRTYILDSGLRPVPVGVHGELYIGGAGVGRGYLNETALTGEKFLPDPFGGERGGRMYRSGDLARYMADGNIELLGRADYQVKVRGFRIELGEIETALRQHEDVAEAVVITHEEVAQDKQLVAYVVPAPGKSLNASQLRRHMAEQLPAYMIPGMFVSLEALPLNPNGKIDRKALPTPGVRTAAAGSVYLAPRNATEEMLANIWANLLGIEQMSIDDNFFESGGHSLLAMQLTSRVQKAFQLEIPLRSLFEHPTVCELAAHIETALTEERGLQPAPITRVPRGGEFPLSFAQQRLWFLDQLEPDNPFYNNSSAVSLHGKLDTAALQQTLTEIVRRHESLRTNFPVVAGHAVQRVSLAAPFNLTLVDLTKSLPAARTQQEELQRLMRAEASRPFNLAQGPLLRATLLRLAEDRHVLLLVMHHIISDGWSIGVLVREMGVLHGAYSRGESSPLPELDIQYIDFAVWQRQWLQGEVLALQLDYWKRQLADVGVLQLPLDYPRPKVQTYRGARHPLSISAPMLEALNGLARREGVTLFMLLLAAFQVLLHRYTHQEEIAVGTPIAGRNRPEIEPLIGLFINTLVIKTDFAAGISFKALLAHVRETTLMAYAHQDLPFEMLVEKLRPARDLSYTPLMQAMFSLQNASLPVLELGELRIEHLEIASTTAKFDLTLNLLQQPANLSGVIEYNTDLFASETIARLSGHFETLLESIITDPEQRVSCLQLLTGAEHQLFLEVNETKSALGDDACIHHLFATQVSERPDALAVRYGDESLTYGELERRANQVAHYLRRLGAKPEGLVGICMERSVEMLVALLGVLKSGSAYVPLDVAYPKERIAFMLEDAQVSILLTEEAISETLLVKGARKVCMDSQREVLAQESESAPASTTTGANTAYLIYTSGSTGKPKGVPTSHHAMVNFLTSMAHQPGLTHQDSLLSVTTLSFDIAGLELFLPLTVGACVVIASREESYDGARLGHRLAQSGATVMQATPATWRLLLDAGWRGDKRLKLLCGGEALSQELADELLERGACLWNLYGPTETTVWSSVHQVRSSDSVISIGRPIANTDIHLLSHALQRVPVGVQGELYIGGVALSSGYLKLPDLTARKFIPHPFSTEPGARLYRTGDAARYLPNGDIEYLGRLDDQIKLRGHRIEPGEIEAILAQHPSVRETVVLAREDVPGDTRLVAYVVAEPDQSPDAIELYSFLKNKLPAYMLPSAYVMLASLPLTPNAKVDRRRLPPPAEADLRRHTPYVAPDTPAEKVLAGMLTGVLGIDHVGVNDNFFELGGHSLLATQLITRIREAFRVELPLRSFLETPTIGSVLEVISSTWGTREVVEEIAQTLLELETFDEDEMRMMLLDESTEAGLALIERESE